MMQEFSRTSMLIGENALKKLASSRVAVFGIGGVGSYVVEALARSGVGTLDLIDSDMVNITNINRQIIATHDTVGLSKVEVAKERVMSINPSAEVNIHNVFYLPENAEQFDFSQYDYIVDAVDTVTAKIDIIIKANEKNVPIISSMGTGNKLNPTMFQIADIYSTTVCPLARVMRRELKKRGVNSLKVLYSTEEPKIPDMQGEERVPSSIAFVPSVAGLIIAGEVIKDLIK